MPRRYRIGVVGFGIAGAAAATLLAKSRHFVTLMERAVQVGPIGAGLLLQPSGQAVLRRMGLLSRVLSSAASIEELHAVRIDGRTLIRLPYGEFEDGCRAYGVHRGVLFSVLRQRRFVLLMFCRLRERSIIATTRCLVAKSKS